METPLNQGSDEERHSDRQKSDLPNPHARSELKRKTSVFWFVRGRSSEEMVDAKLYYNGIFRWAWHEVGMIERQGLRKMMIEELAET